MAGGTLVVSRAEKLYPRFKKRFEQLGFNDVHVTGAEKDGLNFVINELEPRLVVISSGFYQAGTPYMSGELHKRFPKLNIAAVSVYDYPVSLAPWFIWHGVRSYVNLWEGYEEFHGGLQMVREGKQYISPVVQTLIDNYREWPDTESKYTKRQQECLIMLCCGLSPESIGEELHLSRKTVYNHIGFLYGTFHARNREEMIAIAWELGLVTKEDIRFYDRRAEKARLPEWAQIKLQMNREKRNLEGL